MKLMNNNKKIICSVLSFLLLFSIFICFTKEVNASTSRKKLPYYVDFDSRIYFDVDMNNFHSQLVNLGLPNPTNENYIMWLGDFYDYDATNRTVAFDVYKITLNNSNSNYGYWRFYGLYNSNDSSTPLVNRISPNAFDWQTNYVVFRCSVGTNYNGTVTRYTYRWNIDGKYPYSWLNNPNGNYQAKRVFLNGKNASNKNSYGFTSNVPIWFRYNDTALTSGSYRIDYTGGYDVFDSFDIYTWGVPVGVPLQPDLSGDNITQPDAQAPTSPTITTYTPSTYNPPSFDNSSTTNALESIYDIIVYNGEYIISNVTGAIDNLTNNIKNYFEYIKGSIDYGLQKIINNIKNGIQNMYDNIENFFAPILDEIKEVLNDIKNFGQSLKDFVDLFIHPLDLQQAQTDISNSTFCTNISTLKTQIQTFTGSFSNISEPGNVVYTIDLTGLYWNFGISYIDFSIISPVLPYIRAIMTAIILYSLIVTIFTSINAYIGGNSSKNESE